MLQKNNEFMINQESLMQKTNLVHKLEMKVKELTDQNQMLEQQIINL